MFYKTLFERNICKKTFLGLLHSHIRQSWSSVSSRFHLSNVGQSAEKDLHASLRVSRLCDERNFGRIEFLLEHFWSFFLIISLKTFCRPPEVQIVVKSGMALWRKRRWNTSFRTSFPTVSDWLVRWNYDNFGNHLLKILKKFSLKNNNNASIYYRCWNPTAPRRWLQRAVEVSLFWMPVSDWKTPLAEWRLDSWLIQKGGVMLYISSLVWKDFIYSFVYNKTSNTPPKFRPDEDYRLLTDLMGMEDYAGDMDFKIAGIKFKYLQKKF